LWSLWQQQQPEEEEELQQQVVQQSREPSLLLLQQQQGLLGDIRLALLLLQLLQATALVKELQMTQWQWIQTCYHPADNNNNYSSSRRMKRMQKK
jgi:hypothetical protein